MKKISILSPCYNEEENVGPISEAVVETLERDLPEYDYELVFIDNDSTDQTRPILRKICSENPRIKAIYLQHAPRIFLCRKERVSLLLTELEGMNCL